MNKMKILSYLMLISMLALPITSGSIHLPPKMVISPDDIYFVVGTTDNNLTWQFEADESQDNPTIYNVRIDGDVLPEHNNQSWEDNVNIVINVDFLEIGDHEVKITVYDSGYPANAKPATDVAFAHVVSTVGELSSILASTNSTSKGSDDISDVTDNSLSFNNIAILLPIALIAMFRLKQSWIKTIKNEYSNL